MLKFPTIIMNLSTYLISTVCFSVTSVNTAVKFTRQGLPRFILLRVDPLYHYIIALFIPGNFPWCKTSEISWFMYCWNLAWSYLSIVLFFFFFFFETLSVGKPLLIHFLYKVGFFFFFVFVFETALGLFHRNYYFLHPARLTWGPFSDLYHKL